MILTSSN
ncbi:hypothetical protein PENPOL_c040G08574 [Penicillium polonicum]|nr:hypothetical protein PENPOL_c040G08574 [Penicillium polonicum]